MIVIWMKEALKRPNLKMLKLDIFKNHISIKLKMCAILQIKYIYYNKNYLHKFLFLFFLGEFNINEIAIKCLVVKLIINLIFEKGKTDIIEINWHLS